MKTISIKELARYSDQYIFLSKDGTKVLAADKDLKKLHEKMEKMSDKDTEGAALDYIPPIDVALSLLCR